MEIARLNEVEFDANESEWNSLLSRSCSDNVFLRWEWIHTWWKIFKRDRQLFILTARSNGRLIGVAPFYLDTFGPLRFKYLKLCSSDDLSPDYLDIIAEIGRETEVLHTVWNYILDRTHLWDVISLDDLKTGSILLTTRSL